MVSSDELINACNILSKYCGDGNACSRCMFESACTKWADCELDNLSQFVNECKSNILINKYRGKLFEAFYALDDLCGYFSNCGECIFSRVDTCPKAAVNNVLQSIGEKEGVCTTQ